MVVSSGYERLRFPCISEKTFQLSIEYCVPLQKIVAMISRTPAESRTVITDLVLPSETNPIGNMFGGELLARMDRAASIAARRHSRRIVVTASVNHVAFNKMIPLGSVVTVEAHVSRAFKSSMEVYMDVWIEDRESGLRSKANEAIYTFVAVNEMGNPVPVPELIPETPQEKARFEAALRRKQLSLVLAGKMQAKDATELKALFE
ncbi:acyl-CoA hydrolase [Ulvibacter sp. MAR_2010_11]|nr:acyl-CoA hydrolase [Ulvibacter sp. MAR_2010_11]